MLIATDLSQASERVICTLGAMKALETREVLLIHCMNIRDVGSPADSLMEQARPTFEKQKKMLEVQGLQVTAKMVLGLPHVSHQVGQPAEVELVARRTVQGGEHAAERLSKRLCLRHETGSSVQGTCGNQWSYSARNASVDSRSSKRSTVAISRSTGSAMSRSISSGVAPGRTLTTGYVTSGR